MVVDDEAEVRRVLVRWLTAAGHQVIEAGDSESALQRLATDDTQVVLCDVRMPGKDGLWLASEIRRRFPTHGLLFATGETRLPPAATLREGIVAYLLKPFDRERVLAAVADAAAYHEKAKTRSAPQASSDALERWLNEES
jgi:DNA-binding NtrC family response regulator